METNFDPVEFAKQCIREKVDSLLPSSLMRATINLHQLSEITGYSERYLQKEFIWTEDAKALEASTNTKYLWFYPEIRDCWREFCRNNKVGREEK